MRLVHFALTGTMVGGVERYLATLLRPGPGLLEHTLVYEGGTGHPIAGDRPAQRAPWSAEHPAVPGLPAGLPDGIPVFHFPPADAVRAQLERRGGPWAIFCHDHRWWCPSGSRFHARPSRACDITASGAACALRYHALGCGSMRPTATMRGFARAAGARACLAGAPIVLVASAYMRGEAVRHGADPDRVHVVPLPVERSARIGTEPNAPPVVLFASRLTPEKGPFFLLDAFARMRQPSELAIAGSGISGAAVAGAVRGHPRASHIQLLGALTPDAVRDQMRGARVVVVPSLWPEPFGLVGVEALAEGRPVVTSAVGGMGDWAREPLGVLPVPPGQPDVLAAALDRVLAEPEWGQRASRAGADWAAAHHGLGIHLAALSSALAAGGAA